MNICANGNELFCVPNALISKTSLPNFSPETKLCSRPVGEAAFDLLHHSFDGALALDGQQSVKVVAHDRKRMKFVHSLLAIVEEGIDEECRHRFGLQQRSLSPRRGLDMEGTPVRLDCLWTGISLRCAHAAAEKKPIGHEKQEAERLRG